MSLTDYERNQLLELGYIKYPVKKTQTIKPRTAKEYNNIFDDINKDRVNIDCPECGFNTGKRLKEFHELANCDRCGRACDVVDN